MSPESLLAEKLELYRGAFDEACRGLFRGGEAVTLEYEDDDDEAPSPTSAPVERVFEPSNGGSKLSNDGSKLATEVRGVARFIAEDFAREFNARLSEAARNDPTVDLVAAKYEMGADHVAELHELLTAPMRALLAALDAGDLDGARRATLEAWPRLEKRIRSKWNAYFVLTFQDVSVERKAARDRRPLQSRFDPTKMDALAAAEAARRATGEFAAHEDRRSGLTAWLAVVAVLALAAVGGWLLLRSHARHATAASAHGSVH